jgi:hypothetical protein
MPLLEAQDKTPHVKEDFKIPVPVMEDLKLYAQMTNSDLDHVVVQSLQYVFSKDTEFKEWKRKNPPTQVEEITTKKSGAGRPKKNSDGNSDGNPQTAELPANFSAAGNSESISKAS